MMTNQMADDIHLLAAPFRLIWGFIKTTLFLLSMPLLLALVILNYASGNWDPFQSYLHATENCPTWAAPFALVGAILLLVFHMLMEIAKDAGGIFDILLRLPLFGVTLFAFVSAFWFVLVRGLYRRMKDGERNLRSMSSALFGFLTAFVAGQYVFQYRDAMNPETLLCLATLASASPILVYLSYRALKPTAVR
jgi:hypothetical protein